jgi:hypothetical protein
MNAGALTVAGKAAGGAVAAIASSARIDRTFRIVLVATSKKNRSK